MASRGPDFLIIGAQKSGTTWLWSMLAQHPTVRLPSTKELFFFDRSSAYMRGIAHYERHFAAIPPGQTTGEATATYFYDFLRDERRQPATWLPTIPELVMTHYPDVKVMLLLRDPVQRAISAYYHHMRRRRYPPTTHLAAAIADYPHLRIRALGDYLRYLTLWQAHVPAANLLTLIFEEDVQRQPLESMATVHRFLGLDPAHAPTLPERRPNAAWGWTHILLHHRLGRPYGAFYSRARRSPLRGVLDRIDILQPPPIPEATLVELRDHYRRQQPELEERLGRRLAWGDGVRG
ncbi:MAG: sulfotransferase domain-containing protein [Anaerolineales bacterium]|nr:sulfotransferase domain-containing protein [Anaerolineales bacterium]MCB9127887.1 sulfotransferase domain-containing protein [Ardenticatenales bacterium]MCB9171649.1 sulfotransferase domain-containing protein [Ardenticatenales bacterium]